MALPPPGTIEMGVWTAARAGSRGQLLHLASSRSGAAIAIAAAAAAAAAAATVPGACTLGVSSAATAGSAAAAAAATCGHHRRSRALGCCTLRGAARLMARLTLAPL